MFLNLPQRRSPIGKWGEWGGLATRKNNKKNRRWGGGGGGGERGENCFQEAQKSNFTAKCLNTFVAHCRFTVIINKDHSF